MSQLAEMSRPRIGAISSLADKNTPPIQACRWCIAAVLPILLTVGLVQVRSVMTLPSQLLCYLGAIVATAALSGLWPALLAALLCSLLADYYFIDPIYQLSPMHSDNIVFFVIAIIVGALISQVAQTCAKARTATDVTTVVDETFREVAGAQGWSAVYVDPAGEEYAIWAPDQDPEQTAQQLADGVHGVRNARLAA